MKIDFGQFGAEFELWDSDRDTGIEVERTADDDTIRFNIGGSIPISDVLTVDQTNGIQWNQNADDIDWIFYDTSGVATEPILFLDASTGAFGVGTIDTTFLHTGATLRPRFIVDTPTGGATVTSLFRRSDNTATLAPFIYYGRSRGTQAAPLIVASGDRLGYLSWLGYDGVSWEGNASIIAKVAGTPSVGVMPIKYEFYVGNGTSSLIKAITVEAVGHVGINRTFARNNLEVDGTVFFNYGTLPTSLLRFRGSVKPYLFYIEALNDTVNIGDSNIGDIASFKSSEIVFNDLAADKDFRVEGDTDTSLFHLDAGNDAITIGSTTEIAKFGIDGNADEIQFAVQAHSTQTSLLAVWEDSAGNDQVTFSGDGAAVFNEEGNDSDFRIESDTNANLFFIDAGNNRIGFGTATPDDFLDIEGGAILTTGTSLATTTIYNRRFSADAFGSYLNFDKSRNATIGLHAIVQDNDVLGLIYFRGSDGSAWEEGAEIRCQVDGTPVAGAVPGDLFFRTAVGGTMTTRMYIGNNGKTAITTNGSYSASEADVQIVSDNNAYGDINDASDYHLKLRNLSEDTGEGIGMSFTIDDNADNIGAAIIHERVGVEDYGNLRFYAKTSTAATANPENLLTLTETGYVQNHVGFLHAYRSLTNNHSTIHDDHIIGVVTNAGTPVNVTITLSTSDVIAGRLLIIKDEGGAAGADNIIIATQGAETIDGAASLTLNSNYDSVSLFSNGSNWFII